MVMVLDCSVMATALFEEQDGLAYADAILGMLGGGAEAHVPAHWPVEIGNAIVMAERRKRFTQAERMRFLDAVSALGIEVEGAPSLEVLTRIMALADEHRLTVYDAAYLELALRKGMPLATLDKDLRRAAVRAGVPVITARK